MKIDHVHFYVENARASRDWFVSHLGFQSVGAKVIYFDTCTEVVKSGPVYFVLSSPLTPLSPVAQFLGQHPPGVADIAFCVKDLEAVMIRAKASGVKVLQPIQQQQGEECLKCCRIAVWGSLAHTLIERCCDDTEGEMGSSSAFSGIDHIVLNVASGELERAVAWYKNTLDFHTQQTFKIQTEHSALCSQVMVARSGGVQLAINESASPNSQIQEFLDVNRGPGIQHIALKTPSIVEAIAQLRANGLSLLSVPSTYYTELQQRHRLPLSATQLQEIEQQQILVDWEEATPQALLLQTFTQPIFEQPTFFFELIERRLQARGFGEGNFRALFEAIEREQIKRGSLK